MKRVLIFSALCLLSASLARAEKPIVTGVGLSSIASPGELKATPEMWFYDQALRQYKDPQMAVRAQAELRTQQRQHRLESMKWFGLSNSRPRACSDPFNSDYSPGWCANPGYFPARWNGVTSP
jgi:hypothetical protein